MSARAFVHDLDCRLVFVFEMVFLPAQLHLESNLSSLNIHEQKNVKISLADLAGKKSLKSCQKVTKAIVQEEKPFQTQILNDSNIIRRWC
jgi:hypothetical protein